MTIDNKWKRFSVEVHFSSYGDAPAEWVYDQLMQCASGDELKQSMNDMEAILWYPFEDMPWDDLQHSIKINAQTAQRYAEVPA